MIWIWLALIIIGLVYRKSKVISFFQIAFILFLMIYNDNNPDYMNNYLTFTQVRGNFSYVLSGNWLYKFIFYIFSILGNYHLLVFFIGCISMYLIYRTIEFYTDTYSFCFSLYLIASFVIDSTQLKNLLAMAIWLYFSRYLYMAYLGNRSKKNILKYLLGVILSTSCHASFAITILYLLVLINFKTLATISTIVGIMSALSSKFIEKWIMNLVYWISARNSGFIKFIYTKIYDYSLNSNNNVISTRLRLEVVFFIVFLFVFWRLSSTYSYKMNSSKQKLLKFALSLNIVVLLMLPFLLLSTEFYRFQRNLLIIDYAAFGNLLIHKNGMREKQNRGDMTVFFYSIIPAVFYLFIDAIIWNYENVFLRLFWLL